MRNKKCLSALLMIMLISILSADTCAQESAAIQALATVLPAISITGEHDLLFGTVLPDVDKSVDKADGGAAGSWHIQGTSGAEISLDFTLPNDLYTSDSSATMTITFTDTDASYDDETGGGQSAPAGTIDPRGINMLDLGATGQMDVWIGGTVEPTLTQTGGDYAADVILTVTYTGN